MLPDLVDEFKPANGLWSVKTLVLGTSTGTTGTSKSCLTVLRELVNPNRRFQRSQVPGDPSSSSVSVTGRMAKTRGRWQARFFYRAWNQYEELQERQIGTVAPPHRGINCCEGRVFRRI
jgi:hypothetical protein